MNLGDCRRFWQRGAVAAVLLALLGPCPVGASEALRPELKEMAVLLEKLVKARSQDTVALGNFTGRSDRQPSAGPGIKRILIEELKKRNIRVVKQAALEVNAEYRDVEDGEGVALRLKAVVIERKSGDALVEFKFDRKLKNPDILVQVLGVTRPDPGAGNGASKAERAELKGRLNNPRVDVHKGDPRIKADPKSKYAIEICVKKGSGYVPRQAAEDQGLAFVPLGRDEVFAVKLINDSDHDAVVELTLDGLSMFAFSDTHRSCRHFVVSKRSSALIEGWHRTNKRADAFKITDYPAVKELLANPDDIGTITATFAAAWEPGQKAPQDESSKFRDPFGVGRGDPVQTQFRDVVRQRGRMRDVISVRYKKAAGT
jgi:hypothetical protein